MQTDLYTIHVPRRGWRGPDDLRLVSGASGLAVVPPLWALMNGLWITLAVMLAALGMVGYFKPFGIGITYGLLAILAFTEGDTLARLELWLRGWREAGAVVAASEAGAEELYLTGQAVDRQGNPVPAPEGAAVAGEDDGGARDAPAPA